jgi:predicted nucleic acid-binding protein
MRFIDSNVIAYAFYENKFQNRCQKILLESNIITNTYTLTEAFNLLEFQTDREIAIKSIRSLLKLNIEIITVDVNIIFEAIKRAQRINKLRFIDLIHYTTADLYNCESFITFDCDFNGLDIKKIEP